MTSNMKQDVPWSRLWENYPQEFSRLADFQHRLGYSFKNKELLYEALCHRSAVRDFIRCKGELCESQFVWNERIEFLGDSVLGLSISTFLWKQGSDFSEGDFSKVRASLVNQGALGNLARQIGLGDVLVLGSGEFKNGGKERDSLLSDAFEAVIGAIYLDSCFESVKGILEQLFSHLLDKDLIAGIADHKTELQELTQSLFKCTPAYEVVQESGPDHQKSFELAVVLNGETLATGTGNSKKKASQEAAKVALATIKENHSQNVEIIQ